MRRRNFLSVLGGAAAWPLDALAQHAGKVWRMGFIAHGHESFYDALFEGLREYGYEEGLINLKTAKALGLKVPTSILVRADEVIE